MTLQLKVLSEADWAESVAATWAGRFRENPDMRMCLPTGSTTRPLYGSMASRADFSRSTIFVLDEFGLPAGDPARCDSMLQRDLLDHLDSSPQILEGLNPQADDLSAECDRYEMALAHGGLDLTLVGLGKNGHVGLNEPGSDSTSRTRVVELTATTRSGMERYGAEASTAWGMTIGMARLLASEEIWLLVTGSHKAEILRKAVAGPITPEVPASYLQTASKVVVWADEAAAALLA